jgi:sirohydrochlorin cobaltochelatase
MLQELEGRPVVDAYLSLCPPTLEQAVAGLQARGHSGADIIPMFLVEGHHVLQEMPHLLETLSLSHPGVTLRVTPTLGADEAILPLLSQRLRQCGSKLELTSK